MPMKKLFGKTLSGQGKSNEEAFLSLMGPPVMGVPDQNEYDRCLIPSTYFVFHQPCTVKQLL